MNDKQSNELVKAMSESIMALPTRALPLALALLHCLRDGRAVRPELRTTVADAVAKRYGGSEFTSIVLTEAKSNQLMHQAIDFDRHPSTLPEQVRAAAVSAREWFTLIPNAAFESLTRKSNNLH